MLIDADLVPPVVLPTIFSILQPLSITV
jgi:hypothetical protein